MSESVFDVDQLIRDNINAIEQWQNKAPNKDLALVGIHRGGAWVCDKIKDLLSGDIEVGYLDISFYRDDFSHQGLHPNVSSSELRFDIDDKHILLIDDVIMSGRTIRAALNALFDYGRPASVTLLTVFDINQRELPIKPDICLQSLSLESEKRVKLRGPEPLVADIINIRPDTSSDASGNNTE